MFAHVKTIFLKELVSGLRDRRTLMTVLFMSVYFPSVLFISLGLGTTIAQSGADKPVYVVNADDAADAVAFLEEAGVTVEDVDGVDETLENQDFVLVFERGFDRKIAAQDKATARFIYDEAGQSVVSIMGRIDDLLEAYGERISAARLEERGLSTEFVKPIAFERDNRSEQRNPILALLAPMLGFMFFAAAAAPAGSFAVDIIAGERERKALEPFVTRPVQPIAIILGKWAFLATAGLIAGAIAIMTFSICIVVFGSTDLGERLPFDGLSPANMAAGYISMVPPALVAPAFFLLVTMNSKSLKEAQAAFGFGLLIPFGLAGVGFAINALEKAPFAPLLSDPQRIGTAITGGGFDAVDYVLALGGHALLLAALLTACAWMLPRAARR